MLPSGAWQGAVARIVAADPVVDHLRATEAGRGLVRRYVPGRHPADAVEAALEVRRTHRWATLVRLAEPPTSPEDVAKTIQAYAAALRLLARDDLARGGRATITVLPQALGLALPGGRGRALDAARALALAAAEVDTSLVIGRPERTEVTAGRWLAEQLRVDFPATGVSVRADLPRCEAVVAALAESATPVVLIAAQGADRAFVRSLRVLVDSASPMTLATSDPRLLDIVTAVVRGQDVPPERFTFQLPYGVRAELQRRIADRGHHVRVVIPWGRHWSAYLGRRLGERHTGAWQLARTFTDRGLGPTP